MANNSTNNKPNKKIEQQTIIEKEEEIQEQPEIIEDIFEVVQKTLKIHTKQKIFQEDWTLSELTSNERYFIKEQIRTIVLIKNYIKGNKAKQEIAKSLMIDIDSTLILSRARNGRIINGLIKFFIGQRGEAEEEQKQEQKQQGFFSKLFGKTK